MQSVKNKILNALPTIKIYRRDRNSMKLIKWNVRFLLFCLTVYMVMTFFEWWRLGYPNLQEFRQFIIACGGLTTAVTVLSSYLVDKDKDGRPDKAEVNNEHKSIPRG